MPSAKFIFPTNFGTIPVNQTFTVQVAIQHLDTGWFTNPDKTYMSGPQEVNAAGDVMGHSHVVIELLTGFNQTTPTDPKDFKYFKGLNGPAVNGVLSCDVPSDRLGVGYYRIAVIHSGANHQPSTWNYGLLTRQRVGLTDCSSWIYSRCPGCQTRGSG